jgi:hypothetical protein
MAIVMFSHSAWSALSFYLMLLTAVPMGLMFAPQPIRRDKRTIAVLLVVVAFLVGAPLFAFASNVCTYAWWAIECWFY